MVEAEAKDVVECNAANGNYVKCSLPSHFSIASGPVHECYTQYDSMNEWLVGNIPFGSFFVCGIGLLCSISYIHPGRFSLLASSTYHCCCVHLDYYIMHKIFRFFFIIFILDAILWNYIAVTGVGGIIAFVVRHLFVFLVLHQNTYIRFDVFWGIFFNVKVITHTCDFVFVLQKNIHLTAFILSQRHQVICN